MAYFYMHIRSGYPVAPLFNFYETFQIKKDKC